MEIEVDADEYAWWTLSPERSDVGGATKPDDYPNIVIEPYVEGIGDEIGSDVDRGDDVATDGGEIGVEVGDGTLPVAARRLDDDETESCAYECDRDADYQILWEGGIEFYCCTRCSEAALLWPEDGLVDVDYAAERARQKGAETDGGQERKECPYRGCEWTGREYDPEDTYETIAAEVDATVHWESEHGGEIPDDAEFGDQQCPECYAVHGMNGSVSCSECGFIPQEVRADGGDGR
jgi:hypothetical protein